MTRFIKETRIAASPADVFRFHESPTALTSLIPPWQSMRVAESSGSLQPGSRVVLKGRVFAVIRVTWVALHTEYEPPHLFADRQVSGPFSSWYHRHVFLDDGEGGTILRDEVDYTVPFGALGQQVGGWVVTQQLERMFTYRHQTTKHLVESAVSEPP